MTQARADDEASDLHAEVEAWLTAQMPIIQMHGGTSAVRKADPDDGEVIIELGGACGDCGISPRTAQQIKLRLAQQFDAVTDVTVRFTDPSGSDWAVDQPESYMGVDLNEGGRGGRGEGSPASDQHF